MWHHGVLLAIEIMPFPTVIYFTITVFIFAVVLRYRPAFVWSRGSLSVNSENLVFLFLCYRTDSEYSPPDRLKLSQGIESDHFNFVSSEISRYFFLCYTLFQRVVEGRVTIIYKFILRRFHRNNQMGILWTLFGVNRSASNLHSTKIYRRDWMAKEKRFASHVLSGQSKELAICKSGTQIRMFPLFNVFPQQRVVPTHWYTQIFRFYSTPTSVPLRLSHQLLHAV